ncbi:MAG: DUF418 domain-containing protein [Kangiellaceae bacterium]|nr:DUF418 domain-containing protein [Kangiellaceae bacterium]
MKQRIIGFDIARSLAIFGMVIVNFKVAMGADDGNELLLGFASLFEGRASALFVVLAGVGVTFLTNKSRLSKQNYLLKESSTALIKRGLLLSAIGLTYTPIWPADILHFYGFYFLIAALVFNFSNRYLIIFAIGLTFLFPILMALFDYEHGWDWSTLSYHGFWTVDGMIRHILFNGFHPVIPWCAFLFLGMWLARQNLSNKTCRRKLLLKSLSLFVITEAIFMVIKASLLESDNLGLSVVEVEFLLSTSIIPPMPQYVVAAGSLAILIIILCLEFGERFSESKLCSWLCLTGQMSLTLYIAHVIIGMGILETIGYLENQTIETSLLSSLIFCLIAMVFSSLWLKYLKIGPLESIFRRLTQ